MPSPKVLRSLGELLYALANDAYPIDWQMQVSIGEAGRVSIAVSLAHRLGDFDTQFLLSVAAKIANLDA